MTESRPDSPELWRRRDWIVATATVGAAAAIGAVGAYRIASLLGSPILPTGEIRDTLHYSKSNPSLPQWWDALAGQPVRVTDLAEWRGATAVWRGLFRDEQWVPGTGFPVTVIRVKRDDSVFSAPPPGEVLFPQGSSLFYDDPARDIRIVALYGLCTHLCCIAGWHTSAILPSERDYIIEPRTLVFAQDPVYCACHGAQFDPMVLAWDTHPNGTRYVGAFRVRGPAPRALPVIPLRLEGDVLAGVMVDPSWYSSYCG